METVETPDSYLKYHPDDVQLEKTMEVWYVQRTGKRVCGAVSSPVRGVDRVDAETIMYGFAPGKIYESAAITRHGNFLQWGYGGSPAEYTETGKRLFVNCIAYIAGFDGQVPLIYDKAIVSKRLDRSLESLTSREKTARRYFPADILERYKDDHVGLIELYRSGIGLLYMDEDSLYCIDEDLISLGINTNAELSNLDKYIELMANPEQASLGRKLLKRYTGIDFDDHQQAKGWLEVNRDYLYFFVKGGYRFYVLPVKVDTLLQ